MVPALFEFGAVAAIFAAAAPVEPVQAGAVAPAQFDLAAITPASTIQPARTREARHSARLPAPPPVPKFELPATTVAWGEKEGGPVVEFGALGSKRIKAPDVVHLGLDWDF